jgi:hypothetical protein
MATKIVTESVFSPRYGDKARRVFLEPGNRYSWEEIVGGAPVLTAQGMIRRMFAVGTNTFRGFHRVNKKCPGAQEAFRSHFNEKKFAILKALSHVKTRDELHELQKQFSEALRGRLWNIKSKQLGSFNKIRKPVDLYIEHLVAMAGDFDDHRHKLTPLLFLPLDSQIFKHPELFTERQLTDHGLSRASTYKDVETEKSYLELQDILQKKADTVSNKLGQPFPPIYFDLVWNDRHANWGGNLFETNP